MLWASSALGGLCVRTLKTPGNNPPLMVIGEGQQVEAPSDGHWYVKL